MILKTTKETKKNRNYVGMHARRRCELAVFIFGCLVFGYVFSSCSKPENKTGIDRADSPPVRENEFSPVPVIDPNADFSVFKHTSAEHARFPCALCHDRADNSATPKRAGHIPCASCHTTQFADKSSAICTICHTNAETGAVKPFPPLKSHSVRFDHAEHLRQAASCATCHKGNGAAMTIPAGLNAHNACFRCHTPDAKSGEKNIGSCNTCHADGNFVRVSERTKTYSTTPFSHAAHRLGCAACHTVKAGAARGDQVGAIAARMHFPPKNTQSCASCHNNRKAFGGDDFQDCRRCHRGNNFKFS